MKHIESVVAAAIDSGAWKATKYLNPKLIIRATQRCSRKSKKLGTREHADIILTIGRPNYIDRKFIKACKKTGESFPIKKIQLKYPPIRRK